MSNNPESILKQTPLFEALTGEEIRGLARHVTRKKFQRGEHLFAGGDPRTRLYLVASGKIRIFKLSASGREELEFLRNLRFKRRRPTAVYYYRELQNLRDPLHFRDGSLLQLHKRWDANSAEKDKQLESQEEEQLMDQPLAFDPSPVKTSLR